MTVEEEEGVHLFLGYSSWGMPFNLRKVQADADPVWDFWGIAEIRGAGGETRVSGRGFREGPIQPRGTQSLFLSPGGERLSSRKRRR